MTNDINMIHFHSDDYGYNKSVDEKIIALIQKGKISSVSVLSTHALKDSLKDLVKYSSSDPSADGESRSSQPASPAGRQARTIKVGLHINLVEGKSLENHSRIKSLVDKQGRFFGLPLLVARLLLGLVKTEDIEREITAQLTALRRNVVSVDVIDSHQHIHAISPVAEIVEKLANKYNLASVRSYKSVRTYTLRAKVKYLFLKFIAFLTFLRIYKKIGLPASWQVANRKPYAFMSWEDGGLDLTNGIKEDGVYVIHPYLPFDTNKSYKQILDI